MVALFLFELDGGVPMNGFGREESKAKASSGEKLHHPHNMK